VSDLDSQVEYWNSVSATKTFTHPVHLPWLDALSKDAKILDYGCGYGRIMAFLEREGFSNIMGVDSSAGMIARGQDLYPDFHLDSLPNPPNLAATDESIDAVMLLAVLTCIPGNHAQVQLLAELTRVLKPGALLYISDVPLQLNARNQARYERYASQYGTYGVFETGDGAVCRHHSDDWLSSLLAGFEIVDTRGVTVTTMNGHEDEAIQFLARKPMQQDDKEHASDFEGSTAVSVGSLDQPAAGAVTWANGPMP